MSDLSSHTGPHVLALIKQVPHHEAVTRLGDDGVLVRNGVLTELNPFCRRAAAMAVRIATETGGTSTALTMGPPSAVDVLSEVAACGIDRTVLLSDAALAGSDCAATARALAAAIRTLPPVDIVIVGRSSLDADTGAVGPMIAEELGLPFIGPAIGLDVAVLDGGLRVHATLQHDDAEERVEVDGRAVIAVAERSIVPAKAPPGEWPAKLRVQRVAATELGAGPWGLAGSATLVAAVNCAQSDRRGERLDGSLHEQVARAVDLLLDRGAFVGSGLADTAVERTAPPGREAGPAIVALLDDHDGASRSLLGAAAELSNRIGGHVVAAGRVDDPAPLYRWGADTAFDTGAASPRPLAVVLAEHFPDAWAVLGPATDWGREILARLAVRLRAGLICDAVRLDLASGADGSLRMTGAKPCGDAAVADIACRSPMQLATVRTGCLTPRQPRVESRVIPVSRMHVPADPATRVLARRVLDSHERLDRADVVIGVGRGVPPEHYNELDRLRTMLQAELAATRPVTDAGWLPHGRQVGITSRNISPRLYIALGISGSANHTAGIGRANTVLAINSDPSAAIFGSSDIGIVADWRQAVAALGDELARRSLP